MDEQTTIQVPPLFLRAAIIENSINETDRTIEVVFATENPIRIRSWDGTVIHEILSFNKKHVNLDRLNAGAPVLNNHRSYGDILESQLGVVEKAWISKREGRAKLRFSMEENVTPIWNNIVNKIYRNVSVGYNVYQYTTHTIENESTTYTATDWEPAEISMTPIPADIGTGTRSADKSQFQTVNIFKSKSRSMEPDVTNPTVTDPANPTPTTPAVEPAPVAVRSANPPVVPPVPAPAVDSPNPANPAPAVSSVRSGYVNVAVQEGIRLERERVTQIRSAVSTANLPASFGDTLVNNGSTIDQARAAIFAEWEKGGTTPANPSAPVLKGDSEVDKRRSAMSNAIQNRANPTVKLEDNARQYRHMSLMELSREVLRVNGLETRGMSNVRVAQLALQSRSMLSTSDFPLILGNTINRELRRAYDLQNRTFQPFCRRGVAKDFRSMTRVQLSHMIGSFDEIKEGGEYTVGDFKEGQEVYRVLKYGKLINITWETLINDDLSAFNRIPMAIANKASQKQSDLVWGIITGSHLMSDGKELFHADHGNLATSGTAINEAGLNNARKAMRVQKDLNDEDFINVSPRYMLVGPAKETEAQKILAGTIRATKTSDVNVFKGFVDLIVEPRITGNDWHMAADPNTIDTIEYSFLDGEGELFTSQREGFEIDGMQIKARMVFGAKALDWRGFYKNPGA